MQESDIGWTTHTWNPVHGCTRVSSGCANCYAERLSHRHGHTEADWVPKNADDVVILQRHKLEEPYDVTEPSRVFVNSMGDLFHSRLPDEYIRECLAVVRNCPEHVFQILTKRPGRTAHFDTEWPPNVWVGTSVEDHSVAERLDLLRPCDATLLFVSFEPLLGPPAAPLPYPDLRGYDWVIVGGESGPKYREMEHAWARAVLAACRQQDVAFFFKQSAAAQPETETCLTVKNEEFGVYEQREIREVPEPAPVVQRARAAMNSISLHEIAADEGGS